MERIKVGIIGGGFMGAAHAEALRRLPGVEIAVVTSRSRESAERVASRFNIDRIVADWTDLLSDDSIDVIHNCTPNHLHYEVNKASLKAGKHVFAEKPLTVSSDESRELIRIAKGYTTGCLVVRPLPVEPRCQAARRPQATTQHRQRRLPHFEGMSDGSLHLSRRRGHRGRS